MRATVQANVWISRIQAVSHRLSFRRGPVVIYSTTVTKRLTIALLLCFLAIAIVSNRLVSLRQVAMAADSSSNAHQPLDYLIRSGFTGKFLVPEASQDDFDLQRLAPPSLQVAIDLFSDARRLPRLESDTLAKPPPYILLSVLNL